MLPKKHGMQHYDYLIAGSGLAGLYAALRASRYGTVAVVTKCKLNESNTYHAQGGIAAVTADDDNPGFHFEDTINAGRNLCNPDAVNVLVNEGPQRITELIANGMHFDMSGNSLALGLEGGHHKRRVLHAGGDITGRRVIEFLTGKIQECDNIRIFENHQVLDIILSNGQCNGLRVWDSENDREEIFTSGYTIMALGGAAAIFQRTTNPATSLGQGVAVCYEAGCRAADMEFIQFHPTALCIPNCESYLISEAVRGEGAYLLNEKGERFMTSVDPLAELAPRDVVAREISKQKNVRLSLEHLDSIRIKDRFPNIYKYCTAHGLDLTKSVPVAPAAHYMIGGVLTDLNGRSDIPSLYVCGEMASTGIMGANRLASNSLAECLVFGYRAIEDTLNKEPAKPLRSLAKKFHRIPKNEQIYNTIQAEVSAILSNHAGIIRTQEGLRSGLEKIRETSNRLSETDGYQPNELYCSMGNNILTVAHLILSGALERNESRGAHYRNDFPCECTETPYHTIQQKNSIINKATDMSAQNLIDKLIELAIEEDAGKGDITTNSLVPLNYMATATLTAKEAGVICGMEIAHRVFEHFDSEIVFKPYITDGHKVEKGEVVAKVTGSYRALLTAERTVLNILQRMSGIATETAKYVKELEGSGTKLLDTRKTAPGMRHLDKMAVAAGGGTNHRTGLYDMVLIKDNHIKVAGSITKAVNQVREATGNTYKIEVEATNLNEAEEAVKCGAHIVMLDNMDNDTMAKAVKLIAKRAQTEASGNMTIERIKAVAKTGVDFISVGALTHSVKALDISMNIEER
ncbi:MAG: L-aspartate oxidase [Rikenellaceae bacterium]|nr:L-aspartate oxidase [Rikenellaceae bacterium]